VTTEATEAEATQAAATQAAATEAVWPEAPSPGDGRIAIPTPSVVVLIGAAGAGKSTFARRHFATEEILSSDELRGMVRGDPTDQTATRTAFSILHRELTRRLARRASVVVDATNLTAHARSAILRRALLAEVGVIAIVLAPAPGDVHLRNAGRASGVVPTPVVDRQLEQLASLGASVDDVRARLLAEGFGAVSILASSGAIAAAIVERTPG
jgi:protein phosphatase